MFFRGPFIEDGGLILPVWFIEDYLSCGTLEMDVLGDRSPNCDGI